MKNLLLLVLLLSSAVVNAQKNNYYKLNLAEKSDEPNQMLFFKVNPESVHITFFWIDYEIKDVNPGKLDMAKSGFMLTLANDSTLMFKVDTTVSSSITTDRGEVLTMVALIPNDEIKLIYDNQVRNIKLFFNDKYFDVKTLSAIQQDQLKQYAGLILKK